MKIIELRAENMLKLRAVSIVPTDDIIEITGENGAGKSSILDMIVIGLCGGRDIPKEPIRRGAEKGKLTIDIGDYIINRTFTDSNDYLKITAKDGSKLPNTPQKFLDEIVGHVSFDPLDFINNHEPADQRRILLELIGVNIDELDAREKSIRKQREEVYRDLSRAKIAYQNQIAYPEITEKEEVDIHTLTSEMEDALSKNSLWDNRFAKNEDVRSSAIRKQDSIEKLRLRIKEIEDEISGIEADISAAKIAFKSEKQWLTDNPKIDISEISNKITSLNDTNQKIRANCEKAEKLKDLESHQEFYISYSRQIEEIESERKESLTNTKLPVDGLTFSDSDILYNGIPLAQASDGEKLMISLAISMALNPELKVLRIKDGSLLDKKNRAILYSQVRDKGYQLWFESVSDNKDMGIYIEDGEIVSVDGVAASQVTAKRSKKKQPKDKATTIGEDSEGPQDEAATKIVNENVVEETTKEVAKTDVEETVEAKPGEDKKEEDSDWWD